MRHIIAQLEVNVVLIEEDKIYMLKKVQGLNRAITIQRLIRALG